MSNNDDVESGNFDNSVASHSNNFEELPPFHASDQFKRRNLWFFQPFKPGSPAYIASTEDFLEEEDTVAIGCELGSAKSSTDIPLSEELLKLINDNDPLEGAWNHEYKE